LILAFATVIGAFLGYSNEGLYSKLYFNVANASAFFMIIIYLVQSKVTPALRARQAQIAHQLDEAAAELRAAQVEQQDIQARLDSFDSEHQQILSNYEEEGRTMSAAILAQAKRSAERIAFDLERTIDTERAQLEKSLRYQASEIALRVAEERLQSQFNADNDRKMIRDVIDGANLN